MTEKKKCNLIIDSCCDLPYDLVHQDGIYLIEYPYILNGGSYNDDLFQTTKPSDFYNAMRKGAEPSTSQVSAQVYRETFEKALATGIPTVFLSFTSGLTGSVDVAYMVRDEIKKENPDAELYVVDTLLASIAEGFLVYEAMLQRDTGLTAKELAQWAEEARHFVDEEFMIDDLNTLRRGGRIPATVAVAGSALDVKPLLTIDIDGKLAISGISRGRKKGIKSLVDYYKKNAQSTDTHQTIVIGNADCPKDAQHLADLVTDVNPDALIIQCSIGPVIGSHVGPGMIAIVFWGKDNRETASVSDRIARRVKGAKS